MYRQRSVQTRVKYKWLVVKKMQCTCDACSEERKRYNTFKRLFRINNWFFHRQGGEKYYKSVRSAYQAHITGNTIDEFLKSGSRDLTPSFIRYTAKRRSERYYNYLRAAKQAQSTLDPSLKERDGPD